MDFEQSSYAAITWLKLEIAFFYANILSTTIYLFLHSTVGLKIPEDSSLFIEPRQTNEYIETFERELTF